MKKIIPFLSLAILFSLFACQHEHKENGKGKEASEEKAKPKSIEELTAQGILTPELLWRMGRVSDIQLSPDGKTILYGISYYSLEENKGNRNLYTISTEGGEPTQVTDFEGSEFNAIWRPDGKKIGFLSAKNGSVQIWEMNPDGSEKKVISEIENGINGFSYSPSLNKILFIKDVKLDKTANEIYTDLPDANAMIIEDMMYRHWNHWHDYAYSHVFFASYDNGRIGEATDIMEDEPFDTPMNPWGGMEQINWSPDGSSIAYVCKKLSGKEYTISTNSEIYVYDIESGITENISIGMLGYDYDPVFSPDGKKIAWKSMKTPGFEADKERIIVYDIETKNAKDLSKGFDQSSSSFEWSPDGKLIYFISGYHATYQIYYLNIESKKIEQITEGRVNFTSFALNDTELVALKKTFTLPSEIFKIDIASGKELQLSFTNKDILDKISFGEIEERWIETTDNKKMLTWILYPPDFDPNKKYPAILYCQGGPQSAITPNFHYRWNLALMASNGYIMVAPNRRGLPTFGQAWNDQISGDYGGQNMKDYFSAIDELAAEPYVDEDKLGAVGASYGGFSVFWLAGNHNKRFKAFISHCGMFNLESQYAETDEYFFVNKDLEGPFWENPKPKSYSFSPHNFVGNWDTPIMVISGGYDFRIPYTESMQAFNAARLQDVPAKFLFFPDESHFVLKPQNAILWQREFFGWLDQWLK